MVAAARQRVDQQGWRNVEIVERTAEEQPVEGPFDGLLYSANHDVLASPVWLDNSLTPLRAGGRVVVVSPKLVNSGAGRMLNPQVLRSTCWSNMFSD